MPQSSTELIGGYVLVPVALLLALFISSCGSTGRQRTGDFTSAISDCAPQDSLPADTFHIDVGPADDEQADSEQDFHPLDTPVPACLQVVHVVHPDEEGALADNQFPGLDEALAAVCPGGDVYIGPGTFSGQTATVNKPGIHLVGAGPDVSILVGGAGSVALALLADGVTLKGVTIAGGRVSLAVGDADGPVVSGIELQDVMVTDHDSQCGHLVERLFGPRVGIRIVQTADCLLSDVTVENLGCLVGPYPIRSGDPPHIEQPIVAVKVSESSSLLASNLRIAHINDMLDSDDVSPELGDEAVIGLAVSSSDAIEFVGTAIEHVAGMQEWHLDAGSAWGVQVQDSAQVSFTGLSVSGIQGGETVNGQGGDAVGVELVSSAEVTLGTVSVEGVIAGPSSQYLAGDNIGLRLEAVTGLQGHEVSVRNVGILDLFYSASKLGGDATGVVLESVSAASLSRLSVCGVIGTDAQFVGGRGIGMQLAGGEAVEVTQTMIANVQSGWTAPPSGSSPGAVGINVENVGGGRLVGITVAHIGRDLGWPTGEDSDPASVGVRLGGEGTAPTSLRDAIVHDIGQTCVSAVAGANPATASTLLASNCPGGVEGLTVEGLLEGSPELLDPAGCDCHLGPNSPAIDAGDPGRSYDQEPAPNGCRVNLGAYGNTPEATAAPDAPHCTETAP